LQSPIRLPSHRSCPCLRGSLRYSGANYLVWPGALLLTPALTLIVLVLSEVQAWGVASPMLICTFLAAMILLSFFAGRERRTTAPLLDLKLFRIPAFSGGVIAVNFSYALLYSMFFLMSFAFVRGFHESPIASGGRLAIIPIALGLVAPISGGFCDRLGVRMLTAAGMAFCIAASRCCLSAWPAFMGTVPR
jgi:hypothetical protein